MREPALRALRRLAARFPLAGLRAARATAAVTGRFGFGVDERRLAAAFPELGPRELSRARRRMWSTFLQDQALDAALAPDADPPPGFPSIVPAAPPAHLRPPAILASFHLGPFFGLGGTLARLPGDVVAMHRGAPVRERSVALRSTGHDRWDRARAFERTLAHVRGGGFAYVTFDAVAEGYDIATIDVPLLDGTVTLARGPFALARLAKAPIVPLAARWSRDTIVVTYGEPIPPSDDERAMALAAARWLDAYLRARPGESEAALLDRLRQPA